MKRLLSLLTLLYAFSAFAPHLFATTSSAVASQPGMIDPSFRTGGGTNNLVLAMARQKDGKVLIGGAFTVVQGAPRNGICRLTSSGAVDLTFNPGSGIHGNGMTVSSIAIQADGKIILGGDFTSYNGTSISNIVRLNPDGSIDHSFNVGAGADGSVYALAIQKNGQIIVGGAFTTISSSFRYSVARLNMNGTIDAAFDAQFPSNIGIRSLAIQPSGHVIYGSPTFGYYLGRLFGSTGSQDGTFATGGGPNDNVQSIAALPDGKLVIGGAFTTFDAVPRNYIARLQANGTLDTGFNPGTGPDNMVGTVAIQSDGKIVIGGDFTSYNGGSRSYLARVNSNGTLDSSFNAVVNSTVYSVISLSDRKVIAGGAFTICNGAGRNRMALFKSDGSLDSTFNSGSGAAAAVVLCTAVQPDGKVLIGGQFGSYNGVARSNIARLNADGSLDRTFNITGGTDGGVNALLVLPTGQILIGGDFTTVNGVSRKGIAMLSSTGSLDLSFNPGTGTALGIKTMVRLSDGSIIIGGNFTSYNGISRMGIARITTTGALEAAFNPGTGANGNILTMALQFNRLIIGGSFTSYNGGTCNNIAGINALTGALDGTFNPGTGAANTVTALAVQADGKILVGGNFTTFNGQSRIRIARLQVNGSLDSAFAFSVGSAPQTIAIQPLDGKVIIPAYYDTRHDTVFRTFNDGTFDPSFYVTRTSQYFTPSISSIALQPDGKAILGGWFSSLDRQSADGVARIFLNYTHAAVTFSGTTEGDDALTGRASLTLTTAGSYSGSLLVGAEKISFLGSFDRNGRSLITAYRANRSQINMDLFLTRGNMGGTRVEGTLVDFAGNQAGLIADAPYFSSSRLPANHFSGRYQVGLETTPTLGALPPSGNGYLTCTISTSGVVALVGRTPDGNSLSTSVNLSQEGTLRIYFPLYSGKGFLNGMLTIDDATLAPDVRPVSGTLNWVAPPSTTYPAGFSSSFSAVGSLYVARPSNLPPFGGTFPDSVRLTISGGHMVVAGALYSDLRFDSRGRGLIVAGGALNQLQINVDRSSGAFSGSFLPPGASKSVSIQGVLNGVPYGEGYTLVTLGGVTLPASVRMDVINP